MTHTAENDARRSDSIWVVLKYGDAGMIEQGSLEERIRRAEHDAGRLGINELGRQSHCWLCRQAWEQQRDAERDPTHRKRDRSPAPASFRPE